MTSPDQTTESENKLDGILRPMIYSKKAIWSFSIFFSPVFGGILLMQNLKDIDKSKEANLVLISSILLTALTFTVVMLSELKGRSTALICNIGGAAVLTEYFYKKYFPDEADYVKKKIWKPLIIGLIITAAFVAFAFYAQDLVVE